MFGWKNKYKKAFNYWQIKASVHPLTCLHGCSNLELKYIDKNNNLHLYCPKCNYKQQYIPDIIWQHYKENYLNKRKLKIEFFFRWFDLWVGAYIDTKNDAVYIVPIPMFGIKIYWKVKSVFEELMEKNQKEFKREYNCEWFK